MSRIKGCSYIAFDRSCACIVIKQKKCVRLSNIYEKARYDLLLGHFEAGKYEGGVRKKTDDGGRQQATLLSI